VSQEYRFATLPDFVGKELGVSEWVTIDQARIQAFADCTGDQQWIHTDVERCRKESPFGARVRARISLGSVDKKSEGRLIATASAVLEVENEKDPALVAELVLMLIP